MEIYINHIDDWVEEEDLYREISHALHTRPVRLAGQGLTNFRLLLPRTRRDKHKGYAFLTIGETSTASAFLEYCSNERRRRPLCIARDGRVNYLKLTPNGYGNERIVRDLLTYPYESWEQRQRRLRGESASSSEVENPDEVHLMLGPIEVLPPVQDTAKYVRAQSSRTQARKRRPAEEVRSVGLWSTIQFGVVCEDGCFSIEDADTPPVPLPSGFDTKSQTLSFGDKDNSVRILFNNIVSWSVDPAQTALTFELEDPATFIRQGRNSTVFDFINKPEREAHIRHRYRYRIAHIGCHFRVCFLTSRDLDWFCLEARPFLKRAGNPRDEPRPIVRRNLTDPASFEAVGQYCATIDIRVAYQLDKLFRNGLYSPTVLQIVKGNVRRMIKLHGPKLTARVLESLATTSRQIQVRDRNTKCLLGSSKLQQRITAEEKRLLRQDASKEDYLESKVAITATAQVHHVTITPTRVLLEGPFLDSSNRVLRMFPEFGAYFVRVAFCDEDGDRFLVSRYDLDGIDSESFVRERIGAGLKNAIAIAGRGFQALAWSGSGLGSHHIWFVTSFFDKEGKRWDAESIRRSLGDFSRVEHLPARYGARLSQAFSATSSTIKVNEDWSKIIPDKKSTAVVSGSNHEKYLLTDGVGEISRDLLNEIWRELCTVKNMCREWQLTQKDPARIPSAIQFRCGGAKGVLCLNPTLRGKVMTIRHSMIKFAAPKHRDLEVAATSFRPLPARLNRPLINALEDLGVPKEVFLAQQKKAVESAQSARKSFQRASQLMGSFALSDTAEMHKLFRRLDTLVGIQPDKLDQDGILHRVITIVIAAALGDLKRKARIPVEGATLIGVIDEFGFLGKNEIFAQVDDKQDSEFRLISGRVMVGRSPTIHPGDVRVVNAVVPPKGHPLLELRNVIVFNACHHGRPLQTILSGGDLDGDIYTIYENPQLFPERVENPGQYKNIPRRSLARSCTFDDLADFFVDYVINDQVGLVSTFHLHIADRSPMHSMDPDCIKLAQLHAQAVDYRKTGQAVHRQDVPMPAFGSPRPDFLAQRPAGPGIYTSTRALGHLYRAIPEQKTDTPFASQAPVWGEGRQSALSSILAQPGKSDDILLILSTLAQKFPQIMPEGLRLVQMQAQFRPLLTSFVYHLSRLAAWIPESRRETEWLSEEEILVGTQVMANKAKQLKRRQERLTASTAELFPILKAQLQLIAGDPNVATSTIRPVDEVTAGSQAKKGKGKAQNEINGPEPEIHFAGFAQARVSAPPKPRIVVVDGERVVLRGTPSMSSTPTIWSDDEDFDLNQRLDRMGINGEASDSRNGQHANGNGNKGKGKGKVKQTNEKNGNTRQKGKNKAIATTEPELYRFIYSSDEEYEHGYGRLSPKEIVRRKRRKELQYLYAACHLGASEITTRHFGGNTFAVIALGCLLEVLEDRVSQGHLF